MNKSLIGLSLSAISGVLSAMLGCAGIAIIYGLTLKFKNYVSKHNPDIFNNHEGIVILCSFFASLWLVNIVLKVYITHMQKGALDFELKGVEDNDGHTKANVEEC